MKEGKTGYFQNTIMKDINVVDEAKEAAKTVKRFHADLSGMEPGRESYTHEKLIGELQQYMASVKQANAWNEEEVVATEKNIHNHYIGKPPGGLYLERQTLIRLRHFSAMY